MTGKTHKIIGTILDSIIIVGSFEALLSILNLNQPALYGRTSFYVGLFFIAQIAMFYDLHFKPTGSLARAKDRHKDVVGWMNRNVTVLGSALWERITHFRKWDFLKRWLNYLILPAILFWSTIALFFLNFSFYKIQQIIVGLSALALILNYWYLKELFYQGKEVVDREVFVTLSVVKIYTGAIAFMASLGLVRYYCLSPKFLALGVFCLTFLLLYQALFQHKLITNKNLLISLSIALAMGVLGYFVLVFWGFNYFTAGVFMAVAYNLMWGIFHYHLDHALTVPALFEILIISFVIAGMMFTITNFKATILDSCQYQLIP